MKNSVLNYIVLLFFAVGAFHYVFKGKSEIAREFINGFRIVGDLLVIMTGMIALTPVLAGDIAAMTAPFFRSINSDPSLFAGVVLGVDAGGAVLAEAIADQPLAGVFNGIFVSSVMGVSIGFTIPFVYKAIDESKRYVATIGMVIGMAFIPVCCVLGGLIGGIPLAIIIANTIPILVVVVILMLLVYFVPTVAVAVFDVVSKAVLSISLFGFFISVFQQLTGKIFISNLMPLREIYPIICMMGVFLAGILPFLAFVKKTFGKVLDKVGLCFRLESSAIYGMLTSLANSIPTIGSLNSMDDRGCAINVAFMVCACFALGDHFAFISVYAPEYATALIVSKVVAGFLAAITAGYVMGKQGKQL